MKKKVFFVIPSIEIGGAEKMLVNLSENFNMEKEIDVTLISCYEKPLENALTYSNSLKIVFLNQDSTLKAFFPLYTMITTEQPDIVISSIINLNIMLGFMKFFCRMINTKFVARETLIPSLQYQSPLSRLFIKTMCRLTYPLFDKIIFQSEYMKDDFLNFVGDVNENVVINNFVDDSIIPTKDHLSNEFIELVFVGRIADVKQVNKSIDVLSMLPENYRLNIVGDGPLLNIIKDYVHKSDLENRVRFVGFTNDPYSEMKKSDALILTSHYEGFPNVMLEALCVGIPVFTFLSPGGIRELADKVYKNKFNQYCCVVNDSNALSEKIKQYFSSSRDEVNYRAKVLESFSKSVILKKYLEIIR